METRDVLADAFERVREGVHRVCDDLPSGALTWRPDPGANTIAWLVWHLGRVGDSHVAELAGREQLWTSDGWAERCDLPFDASDTGYGHDADQVGKVDLGADLLVGYIDAVIDRTREYLEGIDATELARVVDRSWDPPVTAGVRLVSIVDDQAQHVGQAGYVRGLHERAADG